MLIDITTQRQRNNGTIVLHHDELGHTFESTKTGYIRDITNPHFRFQLNPKNKGGGLSRKLIMCEDKRISEITRISHNRLMKKLNK